MGLGSKDRQRMHSSRLSHNGPSGFGSTTIHQGPSGIARGHLAEVGPWMVGTVELVCPLPSIAASPLQFFSVHRCTLVKLPLTAFMGGIICYSEDQAPGIPRRAGTQPSRGLLLCTDLMPTRTRRVIVTSKAARRWMFDNSHSSSATYLLYSTFNFPGLGRNMSRGNYFSIIRDFF